MHGVLLHGCVHVRGAEARSRCNQPGNVSALLVILVIESHVCVPPSLTMIYYARSEVYCLCATLEGGTYHHRLHVIDIRTGAKRGNSGVAVAGAPPNALTPTPTPTSLPKPLFCGGAEPWPVN